MPETMSLTSELTESHGAQYWFLFRRPGMKELSKRQNSYVILLRSVTFSSLKIPQAHIHTTAEIILARHDEKVDASGTEGLIP